MEIIVYKLSGCGFCKRLLASLDGEGISYILRSAADPENREDCDKMNALFESAHYPKVVLYKGDETSFIVSSSAKRMPEVDKLHFYYYNTVDDIINVIKKQNEA